jgi:hypothetical protein
MSPLRTQVLWSDPCISSKWIQCPFREKYNVYNRSVEMLNTISSTDSIHGGIDYFGILGDNFYDQDGRLSHSIWKNFDMKTKSTILQTVAGNHELWVCGGGDCGDQ